MDEQMRDLKLSPDEIKELMDALAPDHDGSDFESECPGCTAYAKLAAALSQPAAAQKGDCGNGLCAWRGPISCCSYVGSVGPCCPVCREIVEPDAIAKATA